MAALIKKHGLSAEKILAVTFTNKAAQEMRHRLGAMLPTHTQLPLVATFHGFCRQLLKGLYEGEAGAIVDEDGRRSIVGDAVAMAQSEGRTIDLSTEALVEMIVQAKQQLRGPTDDLHFVETADHRCQLSDVYRRYQELMTLQELYDFSDKKPSHHSAGGPTSAPLFRYLGQCYGHSAGSAIGPV